MNAPLVTLAVMAKAPRAGRTMTRLSPPCTPAEAEQLAAASLADTLQTATTTRGLRPVVVLDGDRGSWLPEGCPVLPQGPGTLDERMAEAFERLGGPTLMVGADTPQLTARILRHAAATLQAPDVDAVLGPAVDGGFWILGLARPDRRVLVGIEMSTADTYRDQLARLRGLGLQVAVLDPLRDVDRADDAIAVARSCPDSRFAALVGELDLPGRVDTGHNRSRTG